MVRSLPHLVLFTSVSVAAIAAALLSLEYELAAPATCILMLVPIAICYVVYLTRQIFVGNRLFVMFVGVALVFLYCANFRYRTYEDKGIDFQVVLKLLALFLFLALGAAPLWRALRNCARTEMLLWCVALVLFVSSAAYAPNPAYSTVAAMGLVGCFAFTLYLVRGVGTDTALQTLYVAVVLLSTASLIVYFVAPSFGRMYDWRGEYLVQTTRLTGISTSANGAGSAAALGLALTLVLRRRCCEFRWNGLAALIMALTLLLTNNKGAMIALVVCISCVYVIERRSVFRLALLVAAAAALTIIISLYGEALFAFISRSGSSDEVTSATGRDRIWSVVIEMWLDEPIFGYGWEASSTILPTHPALTRAATSAHNLYLEILFASGIVGLSVFVIALLMTLRQIFHRAAAPYIGLFAFLLVQSCSEDIFGFPSFSSFIFFLVVNIALAEPVRARSVVGDYGSAKALLGGPPP